MGDGGQAFARAAAHDRAGREAEAIPEYEEALRLGLPDEVERRALLGLGSSLRNVERYDDAVGRCEEALGDVLLLVAEQVELGGYERALRAYAGELADS